MPPFRNAYGGPFGEGMDRWSGPPKSPSQPMEGEELDVFKELQESAQKIIDLHAKLQVEAALKRRAEETWLEEQRALTLAMSGSYSANYSDGPSTRRDADEEEDVLAYCPSERPSSESLRAETSNHSGAEMASNRGIEAMQDGVSLTFRSETVSDNESAA